MGFRRAGFSPALSLLMSAFALLIPPACLSARLHRPTERSSTIRELPKKGSGSLINILRTELGPGSISEPDPILVKLTYPQLRYTT